MDSIPPRLLHRTNGNPIPAGSLQGQVEDIYLSVTTSAAAVPTNFGFLVSFWGKDVFDTSVDANRLMLSEENFDAAEFTATGKALVGHIGGLSNPVRDFDSSGEFHVQLINSSSVAYTPKLEFNYRPSMPVVGT